MRIAASRRAGFAFSSDFHVNAWGAKPAGCPVQAPLGQRSRLRLAKGRAWLQPCQISTAHNRRADEAQSRPIPCHSESFRLSRKAKREESASRLSESAARRNVSLRAGPSESQRSLPAKSPREIGRPSLKPTVQCWGSWPKIQSRQHRSKSPTDHWVSTSLWLPRFLRSYWCALLPVEAYGPPEYRC